jgi:Dimethlysulfonioproprionate lyase
MTAAAENLARAVVRHLAELPEAAKFLAEFPPLTATRPTSPRSLPVCARLPDLAALAAPSTLALVLELVACASGLEWRQTYGVADFGVEFLKSYGWTELIGLRGPLPSDRIACGFLLLGPEIEYPAHAHEAEELYLPLAGEVLWMRGGADFAPRAAGTLIEHPSWMPHAMRTLAQPMLALYLWRGGDLAAKSTILRG